MTRDPELLTVLPVTGTYYFRVKGGWDWEEATKLDYALRVRTLGSQERFTEQAAEPNDTPKSIASVLTASDARAP